MPAQANRRYDVALLVSAVILPFVISPHCLFAFAFTPQLGPRSALFDGITNDRAKERIQNFHRGRNHKHGSSTLLSESEYSNDGVVSVITKRSFPNITPREARNAWVEYHWKKGGGLPIAVLSKTLTDDPDSKILGDDSAASEQQSSTDNIPTQQHEILERTILPIFMKEKLEYNKESSDDDGNSPLTLNYIVTEAGPFYADIIPGSHSAIVTFNDASTSSSSEGGCDMVWNVTFSTSKWTSFYETFTKWTVGTAATTVQEAVSTPRLFSAKTTIEIMEDASIDPAVARSECLDFVFAEGGGLPLLPPIPYGNVLEEGGGSARENLLRIPPLITESVIETNESDGMTEVLYRLNNPGWLTFPFLVHDHIGRVRFTTSDGGSSLTIDWDVEIRPYKIAAPVVEKLVEMTITTLLRNIRIRLTQPDAVVVIKPPRGNSDLLMGRTSLGTVAKDTWLGGVLGAHLSDTRSTMEQTISLFQPWDWGRSGNGDENDSVQFQWTDGRKITS